MTCSRKIRPEIGVSSIWVRENSARRIDRSWRWPAARSAAVNGCGESGQPLARPTRRRTRDSDEARIAGIALRCGPHRGRGSRAHLSKHYGQSYVSWFSQQQVNAKPANAEGLAASSRAWTLARRHWCRAAIERRAAGATIPPAPGRGCSWSVRSVVRAKSTFRRRPSRGSSDRRLIAGAATTRGSGRGGSIFRSAPPVGRHSARQTGWGRT